MSSNGTMKFCYNKNEIKKYIQELRQEYFEEGIPFSKNDYKIVKCTLDEFYNHYIENLF